MERDYTELEQRMLNKFKDDKLELLIEKIRAGVEVKDRKFRFKRYKNVFVGRELVSYLLEERFAENLDEALALGTALMKQDVFHHCVRDYN